MLKYFFMLVVGALVLFAGYVAIQPAAYRVQRTAMVAAPPTAIFNQINDFHKWNAWSPWAKLDPQMKTSFEGPSSGVGSVYHWSGNRTVGEGSMKIIDTRPDQKVDIELAFLKPFAATSTASFTVAPAEHGSTVTWAMYGKNGFAGKAMSIFMDMDKMMGPDFEKGLAALGVAAEHENKANEPAAMPAN